MKERQFIVENIKRAEIEEFLGTEFSKAGFSHSEIVRTPLATRITVFAQRPGMVIGRGGKTIDNITEILKNRFKLENPQMDVQEVNNPDMDPSIVSKQIAAAIERGINYKRVVNLYMERIMGAGAVGVSIRVGGKLGGDISRFEKFSIGYLKYAGDMAESLVRTAYATAKVKLGLIGIQVRIMPERPPELQILENIRRKEDGDNKG